MRDTTDPGRVRTGTFTTMLAEFDWSRAPGEDPQVTAVRLWGPDGWEPCPPGLMPLLTQDERFMADLRLLIEPAEAPEPDPEPDPCP
jgi:hypothetical protein